MPTTKFDLLLVALSLKIGDPVGAAGDDGPIYSSERRSDYLNRAYNRLRRTLVSITKDVNLAFNNKDKIVVIPPDEPDGPPITTSIEDLFTTGLDKRGSLLNAQEIKQIYVEVTVDNVVSYYRANYLDQNKFISAKYNQNQYYDTAEDKFFWSDFSGKIAIFGPEGLITDQTDYDLISNVIIYCVSMTSTFVSSSEANAVDIDIDPMYEDLLLSLAAREAMQDRGDQASVQKNSLYTQDFFDEIKVIAQRPQVNPENDKIKG